MGEKATDNKGKSIGLSESNSSKLRELKEHKIIDEMKDGFHLGVAIAIAFGGISEETGKLKTTFAVSAIDDELLTAATLLQSDQRGGPISVLERLADWGIDELYRLIEDSGGESIPVEMILGRARDAVGSAGENVQETL